MTIANLLGGRSNTPVITPEEMTQIEDTRMKLYTNERVNGILHKMREGIYWTQMGHDELSKSLERIDNAQNIRTILGDVYEKIRSPTISEEDNQRNVEYLDSLLASGQITQEKYDISLKGSAKDIPYDGNCPCGSGKIVLNCHL